MVDADGRDPRIRVVTVCRNDLDGARATLRSVEEQTSAPYEHLILDGASTDGTAEWLAEGHHPVWRHATSAPDRGIYDAMNRGLDGEYDLLVFLNAGDRFAAPDVLRDIGRQWRDAPFQWAIGVSRMVRPDGSILRTHALRHLRWLRFVSGVRSVPHQATVLHRDVVRAVGAFRSDIGLSSDQEYLLRCWLHAAPARLPLVVADCDTTGVSARQKPGAFALQMRTHRAALQCGLGALDPVVTRAVVVWDTAKRNLRGLTTAVRSA